MTNTISPLTKAQKTMIKGIGVRKGTVGQNNIEKKTSEGYCRCRHYGFGQ